MEGASLDDKNREHRKWAFLDIGSACFDCHENVHGEEFAESGVTDCKRCHMTDDWYPRLFDHSRTRFPLEGEHRDVACKECHKPENNGRILSFKIERFQCADCHQ